MSVLLELFVKRFQVLVLAPLPRVAVHVEYAERIRLVVSNRRCENVIVTWLRFGVNNPLTHDAIGEGFFQFCISDVGVFFDFTAIVIAE